MGLGGRGLGGGQPDRVPQEGAGHGRVRLVVPHGALGRLDDVLEDLRQLSLVEGLLLKQAGGQRVQDRTVVGQDLPRLAHRVVQEATHLLVDDRGRLVGVGARAFPGPVAERLGVGFPELDHADAVAHAVVGDHGVGGLRRLLDVVGGAGRGIAEDDLLGDATSHAIHQIVEELVARLVEAILGGHDHRVAQGSPARQDRHLRDRVRVVEGGSRQGVTALVVCGDRLVVVVHDARSLLGACDDTVNGLVDGSIVDELHVRARGEKRRLVEDVGQVRAREARGAFGDLAKVHLLGEGLALRVDLEDRLASLQVRRLDGDLAVEASGAQKRRIEDVGAVSRRDQNDVGALVEAVHLDEELVEGLLALVVASADSAAAVATHRVDLVDEDDGRRVLLGAFEELAHARGAHANVEFHELRTGDREEGGLSLARDGLGEQGLARAGRAVQEDAARDARAHLVELVRGREELADLLELLHGLVLTGDVREGHVGALLVEFLRARSREAAHHPRAGHGAHDEVEGSHEDQQRHDQLEHGAQRAGLGTHRIPALGGRLRGHRIQNVLRLDVGVREVDVLSQIHRRVARPGALVHVVLGQGQVHLLSSLVQDDLINRGTRNERHALGRGDRTRLERLPEEPSAREQDDERDRHPRQARALVLRLVIHVIPLQITKLSVVVDVGLQRPNEG